MIFSEFLENFLGIAAAADGGELLYLDLLETPSFDFIWALASLAASCSCFLDSNNPSEDSTAVPSKSVLNTILFFFFSSSLAALFLDHFHRCFLEVESLRGMHHCESKYCHDDVECWSREFLLYQSFFVVKSATTAELLWSHSILQDCWKRNTQKMAGGSLARGVTVLVFKLRCCGSRWFRDVFSW